MSNLPKVTTQKAKICFCVVELENLNRLLLRRHMGYWTSQQKQLHVQWDMSVRVFYLQTEQPGLNKHKTVEKDVIIIMSRMWVKHRNNIEPKTSQTPGGCSINWATNERLTESSFILLTFILLYFSWFLFYFLIFSYIHFFIFMWLVFYSIRLILIN